jgi:hypothetical protein
MRPVRNPGILVVLLYILPATTAQNGPAMRPTNDAKVCVAGVANASPALAMQERLTDRLVNSLKQNKIDAVMMDSTTTIQAKLRPTQENGGESKDKDCTYILLTQIFDPRTRPFEPQAPTISIGGKRPSLDASDPQPIHRDNLQINYALYRNDRPKPVLDTALLAEPSANVADSFLLAMDREANRVSHELKRN